MKDLLQVEELYDKIPPLYSQEHKPADQVKVVAKFFFPLGAATWYVTEGSAEMQTGDDIPLSELKDHPDAIEVHDVRFFGYVTGMGGDELGYFVLSELRNTVVRGVRIERDLYWNPETTLKEVMQR